MKEGLMVIHNMEYFTRVEWGKKIEDDKYWLDEELEDNFIVFYTYAFAYLGLPRPSRAQYEMATFVSDKTNPHRMLMAQRGLSKSLTSQIYAVWRFLRDPNEKILVMSAGAARAINYTQFVQKLIKTLPITKNLAPRHNIERTSGQSFDVAGSTASDSPSMYAVGAGNQVTGMRASLVIYDDIETAQSVESATLSEKINTFAMEAQNLLMSGKDESITLCTPHSMSSIYIDWIDKGVKPFIITGLYPEDDTNYFGGLAPYIKQAIIDDPSLIGQAVDERLDLDFLMSKQMRIGKSKFKLQYMLDVSDADDLRYPLRLSDLIVMNVDDDEAPIKIGHSSMPTERLNIKHNGFKKDKLYSPSYTSEATAPYEYKILSIDPSGRGGDETALTVLYTLNTRVFIKKVTSMEGGYDADSMTKIAELCSFHKIDTVVVESNFGDGMFTKMLEPYILKHSPKTEVDEIRVKGQKEVRIIENLEPLMNSHRLVIDKDTLDKDSLCSLVFSFTNQMTKITKTKDSLRHDDKIDSLSNGIIYLMDKLSDEEDILADKLEEDSIQQMNDMLTGLVHGRKNYNFASRF
ncbi:phage terminase large subunit [bacterium]|nr:phage terminase large subunit [bacterium]